MTALGAAVAVASLVVAIGGLIFTLWKDLFQRRKQYALDMLRNWNLQTAELKEKLDAAFREEFGVVDLFNQETCAENRITESLAVEKIAKDKEVRTALHNLFNYFEFVASAHIHKAADRKIIRESFARTIIRYYCLFGAYITWQIRETGSNPWPPLTQFVQELAEEDRRPWPAGCSCLGFNTSTRCFFCSVKEEKTLLEDLPVSRTLPAKPAAATVS